MGRLHRGGAPALSLLGGLLSCQGPGSLLPAPKDAPGGINPPPCSQSQRQSQRAACCSQGVPRAEDLRSGARGTSAPQECRAAAGRPSPPRRGPLSKGRLLGPQAPRLVLPAADKAPRYSCTPQLETNLPVTALLQGSKGQDESISSTFMAGRSPAGPSLASPLATHGSPWSLCSLGPGPFPEHLNSEWARRTKSVSSGVPLLEARPLYVQVTLDLQTPLR